VATSPLPRARARPRGDAATCAARHGHGKDHERKHQRHRASDSRQAGRYRRYRESPRGARMSAMTLRPGQPQQRAQDRAVDQRFLGQRFGGGSGRSSSVYRVSGDGDCGQFGLSPWADLRCRAGCLYHDQARIHERGAQLGACGFAGRSRFFPRPMRGEVGFYAKRKIG